MKQQDKELSFIDISGRLHYGVIVNYKENEYDHRKWKITTLYTLSYSKSGTIIDTDYDGWISYEEYKGCGMSTGSRPFRFGEVLPYLRPMSSMTEEEFKECYRLQQDTIHITFDEYDEEWEKAIDLPYFNSLVDFYNSHHLDYRGLIPIGLALEALPGMYN